MSAAVPPREPSSQESPDAGVSRRGLLLGAAAGGLVAGVATGFAGGRAVAAQPTASSGDVVRLDNAVSFYGDAEQAGIRTPPQRHCVFMTFDLTTSSRTDLQTLLATWSAASAQLMRGATIGQVEPSQPSAIGDDTGEAVDLDPASLTVTIGLGPRVFGDEYGLAAQKPPLLRELSQLPSEALDPSLTGGDLSVQACADDPQVAYHAVRSLARIGKKLGAASTRWTVTGFGRASAGKGQSTPRNLMGFKDGTRNIVDDADFSQFVFTGDGPDWQRDGSYQVVRKIQMRIENWDTDRVSDQNRVFGRHKLSGAPLTGTVESDTPDFSKTDASGAPVIDPTAHIRLAAHENNNGLKILRRGYNYTDGINEYGFLDAGLLFISYQKDPAQFETLQRRLGSSDALNEYISHIGSGIFFVPSAARSGTYLAQGAFA